jgi:ATP-dependent Clp protease ATP-binding subunit ClpC
MFERFTDRSRKAMALANQEVHRRGHDIIAPEHILLGILKEGTGDGAKTLREFAIDFDHVSREVERLLPAGSCAVAAGKMPQTVSAKKVIERAIAEARDLNHTYVGTEHMLMGLCADAGVATVLMNLGASPQLVREKTIGTCTSEREPKAPAKADARIEALKRLLGEQSSVHSDSNRFRRLDVRRKGAAAQAMYACQFLLDIDEGACRRATPRSRR